MTEQVTLRVYGVPKPQGSKVAFVNRATKRAGMKEQNETAHRSWRTAVADVAQRYREAHDMALLDGPLDLRLTFVMPRPKSKPWQHWCSVPPDGDKLLRAVGDSLTGTIVRDDARFACISIVKVYEQDHEPPGVVIVVTELIEEKPAKAPKVKKEAALL